MATRLGIMFLYWGRRGPGTQLAYELQREALLSEDVRPTLSVSRQNEYFQTFRDFGDSVLAIDTFSRGFGAATGLWRVPFLAATLAERIKADRIDAVVSLTPHLWTPFVMPALRRAGARYVKIVHNAAAHPGDATGIVSDLLLFETRHADLVVTLSNTVKEQLIAGGKAPADRIVNLFLPDLSYPVAQEGRARDPGEPIRILFFGRIMRYKGLGLLTEALEILRDRGVKVQVSVCGEGTIEPHRERLLSLGVKIINRWLSVADISEQFASHDAVVLSHTQASQSGVAAAAFGAGLPVIATPVGGLTEQVTNGVTGILARSATPGALADAIATLAGDPGLLAALRDNIRSSDQRSMRSFLEKLVHSIQATRPAS